MTDELKKLMAEFEKELAILKGRVDGLEAKVGTLEAQQFSTTTKLSGLAIMTIGGTDVDGADELSFNYDLRLNFLTSFTGKDLLKTTLRSGNFGNAYQDVGGLEYGYPQDTSIVEINRLFYQFPVGDFKFTLGAVVRQDDMLGMFPSLYPSDSMLDITTYAGARGAYNLTFGSGAGVTYSKDGFNASLLFVTPQDTAADQADDNGLFSDAAMYTAQIGYAAEGWGVAAAYTGSDENNYEQYGLSAYWAPATSGIIPSVSVGFGFGEVAGDDTSSWTVGLVWSDAFVKGNSLGFAVGAEGSIDPETEAPTGIKFEGTGDDEIVIEGYYKFQVTDNISVTPGAFYLEGSDIFGAVVKTTFTF
ncbi:MAG: carbohydrate porin [Cyanobacteria bacterium K_DeepCast_0m_m1_088]|nr:carbohydrate porin [Cyanobacteria bacterium K_DeepCast_0m_m1_088]